MAHPVTAQCGTPGRVSLLCFGVLLVQQAILPRAQADAIGFDQALALGAGTPAVAESRDMLEARKAGASGFITKPFALAEVREVVEDVLAGSTPESG